MKGEYQENKVSPVVSVFICIIAMAALIVIYLAGDLFEQSKWVTVPCAVAVAHLAIQALVRLSVERLYGSIVIFAVASIGCTVAIAFVSDLDSDPVSAGTYFDPGLFLFFAFIYGAMLHLRHAYGRLMWSVWFIPSTIPPIKEGETK